MDALSILIKTYVKYIHPSNMYQGGGCENIISIDMNKKDNVTDHIVSSCDSNDNAIFINGRSNLSTAQLSIPR